MRPLTSKPPSINLSIQQSPKLTSHKWRTSAITNISRNTNNSNITLPIRTLQTVNHFISKKQKTKTKIKPMHNTGTNFPSQFLRRTPEQINCILKGENENQMKTQDETFNNQVTNNNKTFKNYPTMSRHQRLSLSQFQLKRMEENINNNNNNQQHTQCDRYQPQYFSHYQAQIKDPSLISKEISENYPFHKDNRYNVSIKHIKSKSLVSDIFMLKNIQPHNNTTNNDNKDITSTQQNDKCRQRLLMNLSSDVFNTKPMNEYSKAKSGEKHLFINKVEKYTNVRESKSSWKDQNGLRIYTNNLGSLNYNIISPGIVGITPSKQSVECSLAKNKGLSEFIDLTRVSAPNYNTEYQKFYNENKQNFKKVKGLCGDYLESYGFSKGIASKPFVKEKDINI